MQISRQYKTPVATEAGMVFCLAKVGGISRYASAQRRSKPAVPNPDKTAAAYAHISDEDCPNESPMVPKIVKIENKGSRPRRLCDERNADSSPSATMAKPFDNTFRIQTERLRDSGITPPRTVEKKAT